MTNFLLTVGSEPKIPVLPPNNRSAMSQSCYKTRKATPVQHNGRAHILVQVTFEEVVQLHWSLEEVFPPTIQSSDPLVYR